MIAEYPSVDQIPDLRRLWKEAFGDTDDFLDAFFETAFSPRRCRCITEQGSVQSVMYWFEVTCDGQRFAYLYAVATAKKSRGRGLFSALLEDVKQILKVEGYAGILLVPEGESLARMYEKFGFEACTCNRECIADAGEVPVLLREIGAQEYAKLRRRMLPENSVLQEGEMLDFLSRQYHFWAGEGWLATGQIYNGKLVCCELLGDEGVMPGLLRALEVPVGHFRVPGEVQPFGWLLPLQSDCGRPAYFGLALD